MLKAVARKEELLGQSVSMAERYLNSLEQLFEAAEILTIGA